LAGFEEGFPESPESSAKGLRRAEMTGIGPGGNKWELQQRAMIGQIRADLPLFDISRRQSAEITNLPVWSVQLIHTLFVTVSTKRTVAPGTGCASDVRTIPMTADGGFAGLLSRARNAPTAAKNKKNTSKLCKRQLRLEHILEACDLHAISL